MTTMTHALPDGFRPGAVGSEILPNVRRMFTPRLRRYGSSRTIQGLSDHLLADIGLQRQDVMSPEARREMDRFNLRTLW